MELPAPDDVALPYGGRNWTSEQKLTVPVPVADGLFVLGQVGSKGDAVDPKQTALTGKAMVGWKWVPIPWGEVTVRTGRVVSYSDLYAATRFSERGQFAVEFLAKVQVLGPLRLEYTGTALPAPDATAQNKLNQEIRLALPLGQDNELYVGAKYQWDDSTTPKSWSSRTQALIGLQFRH